MLDRGQDAGIVVLVSEYSKNPYPLRNRIIPKKATDRARNHGDTGRVAPGALAVAKFLIGYGFLLLSHDSWDWRSLGVGTIVYCPTPHFSADFDTGHGIKQYTTHQRLLYSGIVSPVSNYRILEK